MKILFLITKSNWGGAQRYVYDLATNMPEHEIVVALGGIGEKNAVAGALSQKLAEKNIRTVLVSHFMRNMSLLKDVYAFFEVLSLLHKEKPTVIHANSSKAGGIGMVAGFFAGVPKRIFTVHGFAFSEDRNTLALTLIRFASWLTLLFATKAICVSKTDADIASKWAFVGKKVTYIPNGIQTPHFLEREAAQQALAPHTPKDRDTVWIGTIAEMHPNKGLSYALDACSLLQKQGKKFFYCIIGDGEEKHTLQEKIEKLNLGDSVILAGHVPDAAKYLRAFDIFLLPSTKEGLAYVVLEAGMASNALVASDIPMLRNILTHEVTALLTKTKNAASISQTLEKLIDTPSLRDTLGVSLHNTIVQSYSFEKMVEKTLELYS